MSLIKLIKYEPPLSTLLPISRSQEGFEDPDGKAFNLRIAVQETVTPDLLFAQAKELGEACKAQLIRDQVEDPSVRDCLFFIIDVTAPLPAPLPAASPYPSRPWLSVQCW